MNIAWALYRPKICGCSWVERLQPRDGWSHSWVCILFMLFINLMRYTMPQLNPFVHSKPRFRWSQVQLDTVHALPLFCFHHTSKNYSKFPLLDFDTTKWKSYFYSSQYSYSIGYEFFIVFLYFCLSCLQFVYIYTFKKINPIQFYQVLRFRVLCLTVYFSVT